MGTRLAWVMVLALAVEGCALVGFDEDEGDAGHVHRDDGGAGHRDAAADDAGDVPVGRVDAGPLDAGRDAGAMDAGLDAAVADAAAGDAGTDAGGGADDGGTECPATPFCEQGKYVRCTSGVLEVTDCLAVAGSCQAGSCDADEGCIVVNLENDTPCEDGLFCSVEDRCHDGVCMAGRARDCSDLDNACMAGVCDEVEARCVAEPANAGASCGSGALRCDAVGRCSSGDLCAVDACSLTCSTAGTLCDLRCGNATECNLVCDVGNQCDIRCAGAGDACNVTCRSGATCNVACATPSDCANVTCAPDATCNLDCESGTCPAPITGG